MATTLQEITLTQAIAAAPSKVYAAFTSDFGWVAWCCERAEIEPRVGGSLHIYTQGYNAYGQFKSLERERVAEFTWDGDGEPPTLIRVTLEQQQDGTHVSFKVTGTGPQDEWDGIVEFLERTWGRALRNLKAVLEAQGNPA